MVNELTPDDKEDGDCVVMVSFILVHVGGYQSGGGQGVSGDRSSGSGDTISIVGG